MNLAATKSTGRASAVAPTVKARSRYGGVAVVLLVILLFGAIRFRLRDFPLERDEGEYAYAGQLILQGIPPYQLAYIMKLPGTYAAYAAILAVFGQTPAGIHLGLILVNAATTLLLYFLAGRLFGQMAAVVAACTFAALSASPSGLGLAGHASHFVLLPALAGLLLLLKALESKWISLFFCSGLLLGLAFLMKQPGIFFPVFAGLYLVYRECLPWPPEWPRAIARAGAYFAGAIVPFGVTCAWLAAAGVFDKFWFWTFTYAREYGTIVGLAQGLAMFRQTFPAVVGPALTIWVLAVVGFAALLWDREARAHAAFTIGFLLFSAAAVCPGFYFRQHYFILVFPAVAILAGVAVSSITRKLLAEGLPHVAAAVPMGIFIIGFGYMIFQQRAIFFEAGPLEACRELYGSNPFPEALKIAEYIRAHSSTGDRIAVLGSEPEIYFYSGRRSATGFIYTYGLMEKQPYALTMQKEMIAEMEAAHPQYIVAVNVPTSWLLRPESPKLILTWAREYMTQQYERVGVIDIGEQSHYLWGEAAKESPPHSPFSVSVFRRKVRDVSMLPRRQQF